MNITRRQVKRQYESTTSLTENFTLTKCKHSCNLGDVWFIIVNVTGYMFEVKMRKENVILF